MWGLIYRQQQEESDVAEVIRFAAQCPCGNRDAFWTTRAGQVNSQPPSHTIECDQCPRPPGQRDDDEG